MNQATGEFSGMPLITGTYTFTVKATDAADGAAGVSQFIMQALAPSAATVLVSGRMRINADRRG